MSKFEKAKGWIKEHGEDITVISIFTATTAAVVGLAIWTYKSEVAMEEENERQAQALQETLTAAVARGDSVLPGGPNGYWIIPNTRSGN